MAIARMKKLDLVGMIADKDEILDLMQKTSAVEIISVKQGEEQTSLKDERLEEVEKAINVLSQYAKSKFLTVNYGEFLSYKDKQNRMLALSKEILELDENLKKNISLLEKTEIKKSEAEVYGKVERDFSSFSLKKFKTFFGCIKKEKVESVNLGLNGVKFADFCLYQSDVDRQPILAVAMPSAEGEVDKILTANGFSVCPFDSGNGINVLNGVESDISKIKEQISCQKERLKSFSTRINELKIFYDYLLFVGEKAESGEKMSYTDSTFYLKAYVPAEEVKNVESVLSVKENLYMEFSEPTEQDTPPVLMKNNKVVRNFENVTNLYSPPSYREFDPNTVMSIFFSLFLGYITADFAYGVLMIIFAFVMYFKNGKRDNGITRLFWVIGYGGIFAMLWGVLFNSYFGFALPFYKALMPDPQKAYWSFAGIRVPANLIISMLLGVLHLVVGYICKAVQQWRRGNVLDGLIDGIVWGIFMLGLGVLIIAETDYFNAKFLVKPCVYVLIISLAIAVLFAGRKEKFFGKFTKGFGAVYGVINFLSDILSYARLYGMMLSGVILGGLVSGYSADFIRYFSASGNFVWIIGAVFLFLIGHAFNLAMGLLGAYIHDSRLQYVEFFSRFFEGEGELFKPLGYNRVYSVQIK